MLNKIFPSAELIHVSASCEVLFLQSKDNLIHVDIKCEKAEDFSVSNKGGQVHVVQENPSLGDISISGGNISIGGSTRGVNIINSNEGIYISGASGRVVVNGREINLSDTASDSKPSPKIVIKCPKIDCDFELSGLSQLVAKLKLGAVDLSMEGSSQAEIFWCDDLTADLRGSTKLKALADGDVNIDCSGSSHASIRTSNSFSSVKAETSGSSRINTSGNVNGNYKADSSGASSIRHEGNVRGKIKKSCSGVSSILVE